MALPALGAAQEAPAAPAAPPEPPKAGVKVGGTINVNLQTTMAKDATNPAQSVTARNAVSSDSSNVFVDAFAEVAFGLKAIARCETSASVDLTGSTLCNRNSRIGLSSAKFGTLFYGNWDTPFKAATYGTKVDDPFMNTDVFGFQGLMGSPGFNYKSSGAVTAPGGAPVLTGTGTPFPAGSVIHGFDIRASNSVAYHSPKIQGASIKLQYTADEFRSVDARFAPQIFSAVANYERNGLSVVAAFERHDDYYGLAAINVATSSKAAVPAFNATVGNEATHSSVDWAWRAGAGYQFETPAGATTVSVLVDQLTYGQEHAVAESIKEYKRLAWQVAAKHRYADHELRARFSMADEGDCTMADGSAGACSTDGYGAKQIALGYAYHLSKSAQAYLSFTKIMNDDNARYTLTIGGAPDVAGKTPKGADPQALGLGIRFAF